jgi:hypothetical protein
MDVAEVFASVLAQICTTAPVELQPKTSGNRSDAFPSTGPALE